MGQNVRVTTHYELYCRHSLPTALERKVKRRMAQNLPKHAPVLQRTVSFAEISEKIQEIQYFIQIGLFFCSEFSTLQFFWLVHYLSQLAPKLVPEGLD